MPWWLALLAAAVSAYATWRSYADNEKTQETGRLWLLYWPFPRHWGIVNREDSPRYFKIAFGFDIWRTTFLVILTIILTVYCVDTTGLFS